MEIADLAALLSPPAPEDADGIVVRAMRLPRTLAALGAGAALGAAGALIQTLTRNPLADPGLLGVNVGAGVGIVFTVWLLGPVSQVALIPPALIGALMVLALVWAIGAASRSPLTLILAGAALTAMLSAVLRGLILLDPLALDVYRDWALGAVDAARFEVITPAAPLLLLGLGLGLLAARRLDALALGDDLALTLGTDLARARALTLAATGILAASAVLAAGPLAFVGLIAPHLARMLRAESTRALMLSAAGCGAALVLAADLAGRIVAPGLAIEVGLGISLIGGMFLIWRVRRLARDPA